MQTDPLPLQDPLAWQERSLLRTPERLFLTDIDGRIDRLQNSDN